MDSAQVSSRKPKLWMKLDEARDTPSDSSGNSLSVTLNGTPRAYQVSTSKGPGIDLGGNADIEVAHNAVFETDHGIARDNASVTWVYSEVTLSGQFKVNAFTAGEDTYLFGKSGDPAAWANSLNVWVKRDDATTGTLRVVARMPWLRVVLASKTGEITIGTEFHVTVTLGREGLWATLNGRMLNNGEKDPRHWYGWDHRVRGLRNNSAPIGSAQGCFNAGAIRIGRSSTGSRSNITVAQFAVFVTGTYANRLDLADCQALADQSGPALGHPLFDNSTQAVAAGASLETLQAAIKARSDAGGGTVTLAAGSYSFARHIVLKNGVRLKGAGIGSTKISLTGAATIGTGVIRKRPDDSVVPTLTSYSFPGALTRGQTSITATNGLSDDAILLVVARKQLMRLYIPSGDLPTQGDEVNCAEFIPVHTRTGSVFNLEGGLFFAYPEADQQAIRGFDPLLKDCEITDMTIDGSLNSGEDHGVAHFEGARRVFLRRLKITDNTAYGDNGKPAEPEKTSKLAPTINKLFNGLNMYGCVDCAVEDVECNLTSTFGIYDQKKGSHCYASQYLGGRNIVVMRGYVHSNDWTGLDIGADNFDQGWKGAKQPWYVPTLRMEAVDVKGTSRSFHPAFGGHTSAACRWIGCETMNGGGFGPDGWQHEHFDCVSHFPTVAGYPTPKRKAPSVHPGKTKQHDGDYGLSDRGECYACRVKLEGSPGRWFDGIDRDSVYVLVTKPNTKAPTKELGKQKNCQYVSCTLPLPA